MIGWTDNFISINNVRAIIIRQEGPEEWNGRVCSLRRRLVNLRDDIIDQETTGTVRLDSSGYEGDVTRISFHIFYDIINFIANDHIITGLEVALRSANNTYNGNGNGGGDSSDTDSDSASSSGQRPGIMSTGRQIASAARAVVAMRIHDGTLSTCCFSAVLTHWQLPCLEMKQTHLLTTERQRMYYRPNRTFPMMRIHPSIRVMLRALLVSLGRSGRAYLLLSLLRLQERPSGSGLGEEDNGSESGQTLRYHSRRKISPRS